MTNFLNKSKKWHDKYITKIYYIIEITINGDGEISNSVLNKNNKLLLESTNLSSLSCDDDKFSSLSMSAMLARGEVPEIHRRTADNYMIIKKIYGAPVVQTRITNKDRALLARRPPFHRRSRE